MMMEFTTEDDGNDNSHHSRKIRRNSMHSAMSTDIECFDDDDYDDDSSSYSSTSSTESSISGKSFASASTKGYTNHFLLVGTAGADHSIVAGVDPGYCNNGKTNPSSSFRTSSSSTTISRTNKNKATTTMEILLSFQESINSKKRRNKKRKKKQQRNQLKHHIEMGINAVLVLCALIIVVAPFYLALCYVIPKMNQIHNRRQQQQQQFNNIQADLRTSDMTMLRTTMDTINRSRDVNNSITSTSTANSTSHSTSLEDYSALLFHHYENNGMKAE